ncbi:hypothetical protein ACFL2V_20845 [Pseudomonadota bacterium]
MSKQKQLIVRMNPELYDRAQHKCKEHYGIGLSVLVKMFLRAFVTQQGIGFFVGDQNLRDLFLRWLRRKEFEKGRKGCARMPGPLLRDIYEMNSF